MKDVKELYVSAVDVKSVPFSWSEGYGEAWDIIYPSTKSWSLERCQEYLEKNRGDPPDPNPWKMDLSELLELADRTDLGIDVEKMTEEELRAHVINDIDDLVTEGIDAWREACNNVIQESGSDQYHPMMNYYYPLPGYHGDAEADQDLLDQKGGSICLVRVDEDVVLALTGGMDLSWDICHAYMLLGYLPPLNFCNLPNFAGMKLNEKTKWIIDGCIRSAKLAQSWSKGKVKRLKQYKKELRP